MVTQQSQIKINLPQNLKEYLESKADKFGLPIAGYIKYLILEDVKDMDYPIFEASGKSEKEYAEALKADKEGKLIRVEDVNKFFDEL